MINPHINQPFLEQPSFPGDTLTGLLSGLRCTWQQYWVALALAVQQHRLAVRLSAGSQLPVTLRVTYVIYM